MAKLYFGTRRTKVILFSIVGFFMFLIVGFVVLASWRGSPQGMIDVANQFKADPSWILEKESVIPPGLFCIRGVAVCSEVSRTWITQEIVDHSQLQLILSKSVWNRVSIQNSNCYNKGDDMSKTHECWASGGADNLSVNIYVDFKNHPQRPSLTLSVRYN